MSHEKGRNEKKKRKGEEEKEKKKKRGSATLLATEISVVGKGEDGVPRREKKKFGRNLR